MKSWLSLIDRNWSLRNILYSKKLWQSKSLAKRATARHWRKKLWWMLTCIANRPSLINSKTKPNEAIPNTDEHNKTNFIFSICIICHVQVACCLMIARWTVQSIIRGYHEYISKLSSLESKLVLKIAMHPFLDPYAKHIKVHLT